MTRLPACDHLSQAIALSIDTPIHHEGTVRVEHAKTGELRAAWAT